MFGLFAFLHFNDMSVVSRACIPKGGNAVHIQPPTAVPLNVSCIMLMGCPRNVRCLSPMTARTTVPLGGDCVTDGCDCVSGFCVDGTCAGTVKTSPATYVVYARTFTVERRPHRGNVSDWGKATGGRAACSPTRFHGIYHTRAICATGL